ncbi:MAG: glucose-1-phosphate cytidylyltransferase [Actinobacteria bacterium]|nr:glucose-1-phosphate cytidylyltransferase [Actinomycetota bacterium]MCG2807750.1 glucose-1-phosphate cytidylyltransferase [Coriobacteriia bacterium]
MKVVILAGGLGTRISEETATRPKPMAEIGDKPILWHIMKTYSHYGFNDFIICAGYKGYQIKEYFHNYWLHNADVTFDMRSHACDVHEDANEPWRVTVVDTGAETMTGGRVKRIEPYVSGETFMLTYGDGVADVDIPALLEFHERSGRIATLTAVQPVGRFGALQLGADDGVDCFREKPIGDGDWINGGFFVMGPEVFARIEGDATSLEREPLESLADDGQLGAFKHRGFWQPMDTLRDKNHLESLWHSGEAPWKVW